MLKCSSNIMRPWIHETMDATRCTFERSNFQHPPKMPVLTIDSASAEFRKDSQVCSRNRNKKTSKWTSNCHHPLYGCFPSQTPPIFQAPPFECLPDSLEEKAASQSSGGKQGLQLWMQPSVGFLKPKEQEDVLATGTPGPILCGQNPMSAQYILDKKQHCN